MPCQSQAPTHNDWIRKMHVFGVSAVARPVSRKEMLANTAAMDAMWKEYSKLQDTRKVWDVSKVREARDVIREAKVKNEKIHLARVFGICVEKESELPAGDKNRK